MSETINYKEILNNIYPRVMWIGDNIKEPSNEIEFIIECSCE